MQIELKPGSKPVRAPQYRLSPKQKQIVQTEIQKLLKAGIIVEIDYSDFSSPIMLIPKSFDENGHPTEHRLVIDSRKVNDLIVDNVYEIEACTGYRPAGNPRVSRGGGDDIMRDSARAGFTNATYRG